MTFRDREKCRYRTLKSQLFSADAQPPGAYRGGKRHDFCLADCRASENLYNGIRDRAIEYFRQGRIRWHDGVGGMPSNHLCCSQSCCVNFLFPLAIRPVLLAKVLRRWYPDIVKVLPILGDESPGNTDIDQTVIAFEWVDKRNRLGEHLGKASQPTRGANNTSVDFLLRYGDHQGSIHLILGEWKYTEAAGSQDYLKLKGAEVRRDVYRGSFDRPEGIFALREQVAYEALFVGEAYQLMRLQLLARELEIANEMGADRVSILLVAPFANTEFWPSNLAEAWPKLLREPRFQAITTEQFRGAISEMAGDAEQDWSSYLLQRYGWDS